MFLLMSLSLSDEDMQSLASLMSVKPTDIGNLDDFNESDEEEDRKSVTAAGTCDFYKHRFFSLCIISFDISCSSASFFPLVFLSLLLLYCFRAAAAVPHTLIRPNRPAPPPPSKTNSSGPTFPVSGSFFLPFAFTQCLLPESRRCELALSLFLFLPVIGQCCLYNSISRTVAIWSAYHIFLVCTLNAFENHVMILQHGTERLLCSPRHYCDNMKRALTAAQMTITGTSDCSSPAVECISKGHVMKQSQHLTFWRNICFVVTQL